MLTYKGYKASVELDEKTGMLFGKVIGTKDVITFRASSLEKAYLEMQISIEGYLTFCQELNEEADTP